MDKTTARRCELQATVNVYRRAFFNGMAELAAPEIDNPEWNEMVRRTARRDCAIWRAAKLELEAHG